MLLGVFLHPAFLIPSAVYLWLQIKRAPEDTVVGLWSMYWIKRLDHRRVAIGKGTMHELAHPWRIGQGIYIVINKKSLQVGKCYEQPWLDETKGVLSAVQGRYLEVEPKEIGDWGVQKGKETRKATS